MRHRLRAIQSSSVTPQRAVAPGRPILPRQTRPKPSLRNRPRANRSGERRRNAEAPANEARTEPAAVRQRPGDHWMDTTDQAEPPDAGNPDACLRKGGILQSWGLG